MLLVLANIVWATGLTFYSGAGEALLYESLHETASESTYTTVTGRAGAVGRGMMVVGSVGSGLLASVRFPLPFLVAAALQVVALIILAIVKEPETQQSSNRAATAYGEIVRESFRALRGNPTLRYAVAYASLIPIAHFAAGVLFLQPRAISLGVPVALVGVLVMGANAASMAGSLVANAIGRRAGVRRVLYSVPAVLVICLVCTGLTRSLLALLPIGVLCFATAVAGPLVVTIIQGHLSDNIRATVLSLQSLMFTLILAVTEPVLGYMADAYGLLYVYYVLAGAFIAFLAVLIIRGSRWLAPRIASTVVGQGDGD